LLKKFDSIKDLPFSEKLKHLKPLFVLNNSKKFSSANNSFTKEQNYQINSMNKYFYNKIKNTNSYLSVSRWEKDFQQNRMFKKNICLYPEIDFHKSVQRKVEQEKAENEKFYYNTTANFSKNLFKKTKFKNVTLFKPQFRNDKMIDNEHFRVGETQVQEDNREFKLVFILDDNEKKKIEVKNCKKDDFFFDIVDKLCQTETTLDKERIRTDEFTIKGKDNGNEYIDYNDTLDGNKLGGNEEILIKFKEEEE